MLMYPEAISSMAPTKASEPGDAPDNERGDDDSFVEIEESKDDKMRRIAKTLEAGDVVEEAHVSLRVRVPSSQTLMSQEHYPDCWR